jgi:hypothetical protein
MSHEDDTMQRRLAALRRTDASGFYASSDPATGTDATGTITVTVDPTNRITHVAVAGSADQVRDPERLSEAIDQAAGAARTARLRASRPAAFAPAAAARRRPVARRFEATARAVENYQETGRVPSGALRGLSSHFVEHDLEPAVGISDNECVVVTLGLASSHGRVEVDRAWLANARSASIGPAVTQAFANAYRKQDRA